MTAGPASAFDGRLVEVGLQFKDGTNYSFNQDFAIYASGTRFTNANQASCELTLFNLTRALRDTIITASSPFGNRANLPTLSLKIGRESYGTFLLYMGDVISANILQPPDVGIKFRALTNNLLQGAIAASQQPPMAPLSQISKSVADSTNSKLDFQAQDKQIGNFSFTGTPIDGVKKLNDCGNVISFCDNDTLVVLDSSKPRAGEPRKLNLANGMVGIPQVTEQGMTVKMMADNTIQLGGSITVESVENPAANGTWAIKRIDYEIASRDQPFFYTLTCSNLAYYQGTNG